MGAKAEICAQIFDYFLHLLAEKIYGEKRRVRPGQTRPEVVAITAWIWQEQGQKPAAENRLAENFWQALNQ